MRYKVGYLERVIIFVVVIVGIITALIFSGRYPLPWLEKSVRYKIISSRAYGLKPGGFVKMKDLEIGVIEEVKINPKNKIEITFSVKKEFADKIRQDSLAYIIPPPILGNYEIEITCGSSFMPKLKEGSILKLIEPGPDLMAQVNALASKFEPQLEKLNTILTNIENITYDIHRAQGSLGLFIKNKELYDKVMEMMDASNNLIRVLQPITGDLAKTSQKLPPAIERVQTLLQDFQKISSEIKEMTANLKDTTVSTKKIVKNIEEGKGTVGKLIKDESVHQLTKETLKSTSNIMGKVDSINISPGMDASYYGGQDLLVTKIYSKVSASPFQFLQLGGAFLGQGNKGSKSKPEILFGQRLKNQKTTISAGIIEGGVGGGVDYKLKKNLKLLVEGRNTNRDYSYDKNIDNFLLRSYLGIKVEDNLTLKLGITDILNQPKISTGIIIEEKR